MRDEGRFIQFPATSQNTSMSNDDVQSIYEDDAGNIWIGTYKGINKFDRSSSKFTHYNRSFETPNTLSSNIIYGVIKDSRNRLWLATRKGVNVLDRETGHYTVLKHPIEDGIDLSSVRIRSLLEDKSGNFWIGTEDYGLFRYEESQQRFTHFQHDPDNPSAISDNGVLYMLQAGDEKIYLGTNQGLNIYNPATGMFNGASTRAG